MEYKHSMVMNCKIFYMDIIYKNVDIKICKSKKDKETEHTQKKNHKIMINQSPYNSMK